MSVSITDIDPKHRAYQGATERMLQPIFELIGLPDATMKWTHQIHARGGNHFGLKKIKFIRDKRATTFISVQVQADTGNDARMELRLGVPRDLPNNPNYAKLGDEARQRRFISLLQAARNQARKAQSSGHTKSHGAVQASKKRLVLRLVRLHCALNGNSFELIQGSIPTSVIGKEKNQWPSSKAVMDSLRRAVEKQEYLTVVADNRVHWLDSFDSVLRAHGVSGDIQNQTTSLQAGDGLASILSATSTGVQTPVDVTSVTPIVDDKVRQMAQQFLPHATAGREDELLSIILESGIRRIVNGTDHYYIVSSEVPTLPDDSDANWGDIAVELVRLGLFVGCGEPKWVDGLDVFPRYRIDNLEIFVGFVTELRSLVCQRTDAEEGTSDETSVQVRGKLPTQNNNPIVQWFKADKKRRIIMFLQTWQEVFESQRDIYKRNDGSLSSEHIRKYLWQRLSIPNVARYTMKSAKTTGWALVWLANQGILVSQRLSKSKHIRYVLTELALKSLEETKPVHEEVSKQVDTVQPTVTKKDDKGGPIEYYGLSDADIARVRLSYQRVGPDVWYNSSNLPSSRELGLRTTNRVRYWVKEVLVKLPFVRENDLQRSGLKRMFVGNLTPEWVKEVVRELDEPAKTDEWTVLEQAVKQLDVKEKPVAPKPCPTKGSPEWVKWMEARVEALPEQIQRTRELIGITERECHKLEQELGTSRQRLATFHSDLVGEEKRFATAKRELDEYREEEAKKIAEAMHLDELTPEVRAALARLLAKDDNHV